MSSPTKHRRYFVRERFVLKTLGISLTGNESFLYKIYSFLIFGIFNVMYPFVAAGDLFKHEFNVVVELSFYVIGSAMALLMILVVFWNREKVGKLIEKLEEEPFLPNAERGGDLEEHLIDRWLRFSSIQGLVFITGVTVSLGAQTVYTLTIRIKSDDYHDWKFGFGPLTILNVSYSPNYEISWFYQNISVLSLGYTMTFCTLMLAGTLAFVSVQLKMLQNNIGRITVNSYRMMSEDNEKFLPKGILPDISLIPWKYLKKSLNQVVSYHLSILEIINELEDIFSMSILWTYLGSLGILCSEVYRATMISPDDPRMIRLLIEYGSVSFQVFIICFCSEQVSQESEAVARAAYETNFVGADLKFQRGLVMVIARSQQSVKIKAGKLAETSLVTFAWILRTSYSAFMMLRNTNIQEQ